MSAVAEATPNNNKAMSPSSSPPLAASPAASAENNTCSGSSIMASQSTPSSSSMSSEKSQLTNGNQTSATTTEGTKGNSASAVAAAGDNQNSNKYSIEATNNNNQMTGSTTASDPPLPADLKRILSEVARNGSCSWLSWNSSHGNNDKDGGATTSTAAASSSLSAGATDTAPISSAASTTLSGYHAGKLPPSSSTTANTATNNNSNKTTKYALGLAIPSSNNRSQNRRPYAAHSTNANRLGTSSPHFPSAAAGVPKPPTRNKHRNGVKVAGRRRLPEGGSKTQTGTTAGGVVGSRKRPLFLIRTTAAGATAFSPGSVGSGRTSGSEPDDSTQYECDSEGTSATSCSELSTERRDQHLKNLQRVAMPASKKPPAAAEADEVTSSQEYRCLKHAFRSAIGLVLDYWFRHRGGYKLSPAEKRRNDTINAEKQPISITKPAASFPSTSNASSTLVNGEKNHGRQDDGDNAASTGKTTNNNSASEQTQVGQQQQTSASSDSNTSTQQEGDSKLSYVSAEDIFRQRRQRLLMMLAQSDQRHRATNSLAAKFQAGDDGPPFTIQRIAEVLIAPERYYTQTHKLCNCLEKLLLVTSSTSAFGGSTGGATSQSRLEERELAALADERGRLESEFRQRALKRRHSSLSDDVAMDGAVDASHRGVGSPSRDDGHGIEVKNNSPSPERNADNDSSESSSREMLEAAARSLRSKFDHVGIDPHSSAVANRDVRSIAENRGMTNSPPPPSLGMSAAAASNIALPGHAGVGNFVRQHLPEQNPENLSITRVPSPILFSQQGANDSSPMSPLHAAPNMHNMLHMHHPHAAPLGGVSMGSTHSTHTPFDVVTIEQRGSGASAPNAPGSNEGADLEGRSSASNSDVDSESDDVSFDDSASDRSDGSDSGHSYEPFTAARAMALNRIQQQQRLQLQSRGGVLTSLALHQSGGGGGGSGGGGVGSSAAAGGIGGLFRAPDSEYQSGDSIDSTRGEDSGGSDSSSSDLAD